MEIFGLVAQSFRLLFARFGTLFPLAFVPALVLAILGWLAGPPALPVGADPMVEVMPLPTTGDFLLGVLSALAGFFVMGFMSLAALDAVLGKRHTVGEYTSQVLRNLAPIVGLGLLISIATGIGILFLILPGLYVIARFLPWVPAVVFENAGWSGLGRAQALTEGYRWPLVGAVLVLSLALVATGFVLSPLALMTAGGGIVGVLVEAAFVGFYYALVAIFTALVYARLREIKEGVSSAEIAASIG